MAVTIPIISEFDGKGISRAVEQFKQLEGAGKKAQFAIKKAAIPAAAALAGIAAAAVPAVTAASDLNETISKTNVIFGEAANEVQIFADTAAASLGQTRQQALDAAATFGTFGKAAGLTGQDLASFSTDFTSLASDLASFNNTTPEDAINAIGAALRGESEPLRRYGVLLNDATLKAAALELGIYDGTGALTAQQKVLAAQKVIYEQTTDAQGDFERTSDGLANSQRILTAQFKDLQAELGMILLPIVEKGTKLLSGLTGAMAANKDVTAIAIGVVAGLAAAVLAVNAAMKVYQATLVVVKVAQAALNFVMSANPIGIVIVAIGALVAAFVILEKKFGVVSKAMKFLSDAFKNYIINPLKSILELAGRVADAIGSIANIGGSVAGAIGGLIGKIPGLADGGIVTGPTLAVVGEAGPEAVIPLSKMNQMGNVTININANVADERLGDVIVNALRQYNRRSGPANILVA